MKSPIPIGKRVTLALAATIGLCQPLFAQTPVFEARFNSASDMNLQHGATLDKGVSGLKDDSSYLGDSTRVDGSTGPSASTTSNNPADALNEFTVTVWYKARQPIHNDATLFDLFGTVLIWEEKTEQWILRIDTKPAGDTKPSSYWFRPGGKPPSGSWVNVDEWTFIAMTWNRSDKKVRFFQSNNSSPIMLIKEATRSEDVEPLQERSGAMRVIGNTAGKANDRSFDGNIDNLRIYPKALSDASIEKIRQADLKNKAAALP